MSSKGPQPQATSDDPSYPDLCIGLASLSACASSDLLLELLSGYVPAGTVNDFFERLRAGQAHLLGVAALLLDKACCSNNLFIKLATLCRKLAVQSPAEGL